MDGPTKRQKTVGKLVPQYLLLFGPEKNQTKFFSWANLIFAKIALKSTKRVKNPHILRPTDQPKDSRQLANLFHNLSSFLPLKNPRRNFSSGQTKLESLLIFFPPCLCFSSPRRVALRFYIHDILPHIAIKLCSQG